ncbi:MAG: hypothetical protein M0Q49_03305 [Porticoccaceae bacterium]|nr:hypothetical protein [Porticoccaceae bacterium]
MITMETYKVTSTATAEFTALFDQIVGELIAVGVRVKHTTATAAVEISTTGYTMPKQVIVPNQSAVDDDGVVYYPATDWGDFEFDTDAPVPTRVCVADQLQAIITTSVAEVEVEITILYNKGQ